MYANGRGVPRGDAEAERLWRLAAEQGHAEAQYDLGTVYFYGDFGVEDHAEAVRWWRLAAEQGDAGVQLRLGEIYEDGRLYYGVDKDIDEALRWYRLAAEQGDARAQSALDRLEGR